jgi:uncharacterized protein
VFKLLLYVLLAWAVYKLWSLVNRPPRNFPPTPPPLGERRVDGGELVQDPQCGVYIPKETALRGPGETYFCSEECRRAHGRKDA